MSLPTGIWFDAQKGRYRCRIYRHGRAVHNSYHRTLESALACHRHVTQQADCTPAPNLSETHLLTSIRYVRRHKLPRP